MIWSIEQLPAVNNVDDVLVTENWWVGLRR